MLQDHHQKALDPLYILREWPTRGSWLLGWGPHAAPDLSLLLGPTRGSWLSGWGPHAAPDPCLVLLPWRRGLRRLRLVGYVTRLAAQALGLSHCLWPGLGPPRDPRPGVGLLKQKANSHAGSSTELSLSSLSRSRRECRPDFVLHRNRF